MKVIRWVLGRIILAGNALTKPKGVIRTANAQREVDVQTNTLALYQFEACPFCVKVRRSMDRLSLNVELRDAKNDTTHREALLTEGGRVKVPCLRIEEEDNVTWMYESDDIIRYLEQRFSPS